MLISRKPLRDQAYQQILALVHRGDLPPGTRVRDATLATQLGVSRTPVREALLQLAQEGVLAADMGRGFRVGRLDLLEMQETGVVLTELEILGLRTSSDLPADRLSRLGELDRELSQTRGDADRIVSLEEEWHRDLLSHCPNKRLQQMIANLWQVPRRYMRAYLRDAGRVSLSTQHHARIIEALRRRDREAAEVRLRHHWNRGIEELSRWMER
jgi:DNA-binding GntR family transcriptional regulator